MLKVENYTLSNILDIRAQTGADPAIIERMVYAFGLLEAIARTARGEETDVDDDEQI